MMEIGRDDVEHWVLNAKIVSPLASPDAIARDIALTVWQKMRNSVLGQIKPEDLMRQLEGKHGYNKVDDETLGYFHYYWLSFEFGRDGVRIEKSQGYNGEEDMASEWFDGKWECSVPRQAMDNALAEMIDKGCSTLKGVDVAESFSGRKAYGTPNSGEMKTYRTDLTLNMKIAEKPIVYVDNPQEVSDAGKL